VWSRREITHERRRSRLTFHRHVTHSWLLPAVGRSCPAAACIRWAQCAERRTRAVARGSSGRERRAAGRVSQIGPDAERLRRRTPAGRDLSSSFSPRRVARPGLLGTFIRVKDKPQARNRDHSSLPCRDIGSRPCQQREARLLVFPRPAVVSTRRGTARIATPSFHTTTARCSSTTTYVYQSRASSTNHCAQFSSRFLGQPRLLCARSDVHRTRTPYAHMANPTNVGVS